MMQAKRLDTSSPFVRNRIVNDMFKKRLLQTGRHLYILKSLEEVFFRNFDDDMVKIKDVDWIISNLERLDIKQLILRKVEEHHRKPRYSSRQILRVFRFT
jgi:3-hydroxyacyl-CoA dehydrogenase